MGSEPKPRFLCMEKDDLIWEQLDEATDEWFSKARSNATLRAVGNFILEKRPGQAELMHSVIKGGYNLVYRLEYKDGSSVIMRVPIKGGVPFPEEKMRYEVATMRFVAANTSIPVPQIYHHGPAAENPAGLGPFMIMEYIDHYQNMSRELLDPTRPISESPVLDPNIDEAKLESLYSQMASILLQLYALDFSQVGSLVEDNKTGSTVVKGRPLTMNINDILVHTSAPANIIPSGTYADADGWYKALADMHMAQLAFQHNDAVDDEDDARDRYVARQLFRNVAGEGRLAPASKTAPSECFKLFLDDFRPANVLLNKDLLVVGVIDWEFAYAAPTQFSQDPPWWLLLEQPEYWKGGYKAWMEAYEPRLKTFLRVLEAEEHKMATARVGKDLERLSIGGSGDARVPLSQHMRESWEKKTWMVNYAARKSWAFDFVWWRFLDESFLGANERQDHQARVKSLRVRQKEIMEEFVATKMEEAGDRRRRVWSVEDAASVLDKLLV